MQTVPINIVVPSIVKNYICQLIMVYCASEWNKVMRNMSRVP